MKTLTLAALIALAVGCASTDPARTPGSTAGFENEPLPTRAPPQQETTGSVPHTQVDFEEDAQLVEELSRRAFLLPGLQNRPTTVSLPGARGMWLVDEVEIERPDVIVGGGREFAHIHGDGSLHAPLPLERAFEVQETGWGERHPWADDREGWDGFVMLFTPRSTDELDVTFQLVVESYNFVTGRTEHPESFAPER